MTQLNLTLTYHHAARIVEQQEMSTSAETIDRYEKQLRGDKPAWEEMSGTDGQRWWRARGEEVIEDGRLV